MRRLLLLATLLPISAFADVTAPARPGCGTARHLPEIRERTALVVPSIGMPDATFGPATKTQRDAFATFPNVRTSANFVLKWGPSATYSETIATLALEALEAGWTVQMLEMGHPVPDGSDTYLLNVYIGNSGGGAPTINFDGAYATIDAQGYPYVVLSPSITEYFEIPGYEGYAATTVVHELYHTVQFATGSFALDDAYWFWEATADWAAGEVYPADESSYAFVGAWSLYPHVPIDFADYYDEGNLIELHQYGASIFPQFLTDVVSDPQLVRDAWVGGGPNGDPLVELDLLLAADGSDIRSAFADFAARFPLWDYPRGEMYQYWADYYGDAYPSEDARVVDAVFARGTSGWDRAPQDTLPGAFGINVIRLSPTSRNIDVSVRLRGDGSLGSASTLRAFVSRRAAGAEQYHELVFEGDRGTVEVDADADELFLVVVPLPASDQGVEETFDYEYRVDAGGGGKEGACAVGGLDGGGRGALAALAMLAVACTLAARLRAGLSRP